MNSPTFYKEDLAYVHNKDFSQLAEGAADYLLSELDHQAIHSGLIVDLGCGSGLLAEKVIQQGFDCLGVDFSRDLLAIAKERAPKAEFIHQSIFQFDFPSETVAITSIGECINYLFDHTNNLSTLSSLFSKVYTSLKDDGIFLFDFLIPGTLSPETSNKKVIETDEYILFVLLKEEGDSSFLRRDITLFRNIGDYYRRSEESHKVRLYKKKGICSMLKKAGFKRIELLNEYSGLPFRQGHIGFKATK